MSDDSTGSTGESRKVSGPPRSLAFASVIVALAIALVVVTVRSDSERDSSATVRIIPSPKTVGVWHPATITSTGPDRSQPTHRMAYVAGEFRVTSSAANTAENRRELWFYDHDFTDVDVTVRIDKPTMFRGKFHPQPGIALRYTGEDTGSGRALIIDTNIWSEAFDQLIVGVWSWPASTPTKVRITPLGDPIYLQGRALTINGVRHVVDSRGRGTDIFSVTRPDLLDTPNGFNVGDHIDIDTGVDPTYAQKNAVITLANPKYGVVWVRHDGAGKATDFANEFGAIRFHYDRNKIDPKALYPRFVRARVTGRLVRVKSWLVGFPEPDWQLTARIAPGVEIPESGKIGLVTNHLHGAGNYIAFGDVTIDPIERP